MEVAEQWDLLLLSDLSWEPNTCITNQAAGNDMEDSDKAVVVALF